MSLFTAFLTWLYHARVSSSHDALDWVCDPNQHFKETKSCRCCQTNSITCRDIQLLARRNFTEHVKVEVRAFQEAKSRGDEWVGPGFVMSILSDD